MDQSNRGRFWLAWAAGLLFAANCFVFNFVVAPVEKRADLTADRRYTLPEPIVRIARKLDPNADITFFKLSQAYQLSGNAAAAQTTKGPLMQ